MLCWWYHYHVVSVGMDTADIYNDANVAVVLFVFLVLALLTCSGCVVFFCPRCSVSVLL